MASHLAGFGDYADFTSISHATNTQDKSTGVVG